MGENQEGRWVKSHTGVRNSKGSVAHGVFAPGAGLHQDFTYLRKLGVQKNLTLLRFFLTVDFGTVMLAYRQIKEKPYYGTSDI